VSQNRRQSYYQAEASEEQSLLFHESSPFLDLPPGTNRRGERVHFRSRQRAEQWIGSGLGWERMWPANPLKRKGNKRNVTQGV